MTVNDLNKLYTGCFSFEEKTFESVENMVNRLIRKVMDEVGQNFRAQFENISDEFRRSIDESSSDLFLSVLSKAVYVAAVPLVATLGITHYFAVLKEKISRPELAQDVRLFHLKDRVKKAANSMLTPAIVTVSLSYFLSSYLSPFKDVARYGICSLSHPLQRNFERCLTRGAPTASLIKLSLGIGALTAAWVGYRIFREESKKSAQNQESMPILDVATMRSLDRIAKSTQDLKENHSFLQNVLFYGVGGTGKTMAAKALAKNSNMNFVMMSGGDLPQYLEKGTHVSELNKLFNMMKSYKGQTLLFIDEAESLCQKRSDIIKDRKRVELINAFLNHTGDNSKRIMLVLATNRPEDLDEAILSRMDHKLHLSPPGYRERKQIIKMHADQTFTQEEAALFTGKTLDAVALDTEGMTGRSLFKMINSLQSYKNQEPEGRLSQKLIFEVTGQFKGQEERMRKRTFVDRAHSAFWRTVGDPL